MHLRVNKLSQDVHVKSIGNTPSLLSSSSYPYGRPSIELPRHDASAQQNHDYKNPRHADEQAHVPEKKTGHSRIT